LDGVEAGGRSDQRGAAEVGEVTVVVFGYRHPEQSEGSIDFGFWIGGKEHEEKIEGECQFSGPN
jgi:hypothetical protein